MFKAISFGVFCRSAPSNKFNHAVDEGRTLRGRNAYPDPVRQHLRAAGDRRSVAAGLPDHRRGFASNRGLVDRRHAFDHLAVRRDIVARFHQDNIADLQTGAGYKPVGLVITLQQLGLTIGARFLQRFRLCLAAALCDGFSEVGEQHREPQPQNNLECEGEIGAAGDDILQEDHRR
jgi:hypothetical protein